MRIWWTLHTRTILRACWSILTRRPFGKPQRFNGGVPSSPYILCTTWSAIESPMLHILLRNGPITINTIHIISRSSSIPFMWIVNPSCLECLQRSWNRPSPLYFRYCWLFLAGKLVGPHWEYWWTVSSRTTSVKLNVIRGTNEQWVATIQEKILGR